ncbi:MAG: MDR family MFS transporter [Methylophilaceae bacterium]
MEATNYTSSPKKFGDKLLAMIGLCFVLIMVALDQTVIGTALPTVVAELNGFELYAWVGTSYLLTSVVAVPIFGKLGDEYGRKSFIIIAIVLFTVASMLCGMAQSMLQLVLARALQGIGGGMLVATSFASIPDIFPDTHERLRWQVLFSTAFGLANAVGPSIGGYLTEYWGWRWVFFVNLPVGILSLAFIWRFLPKIRHSNQPPSPMDWLGAFLIALTLGSLQLMVEWLLQNKPAIQLVPLAIIGFVSGFTLFWWELRCKNPVIPLGMFKDNILGPVFALSSMMGFCLFAVMYYAPLMFQGGFGLSPNQAGALVTPLAVFITVGSIVNGRIMSRIDSPNLVLYFGLSAFLISAVTMTQVTILTSHTMIIVAMALGGLGMGLLLPNLTLIVQASAAKTQLGIATAMLQSMRMVGSMMGAAVIGSIISSQYTSKIHSLLTIKNSTQLEYSLDNPQILFSNEKSEQFLHLLPLNRNEGLHLLAYAKEALVNAVHDSQWFITVLVLLAFWLAYYIPKVNIHSKVTKVTSGNP